MADSNHNKYVYEIPYLDRKSLIRLLDFNESWKELGGRMGYSTFDIVEIDNDYKNRGISPTESLLTRWGQQNHMIVELFVLLYHMKHHNSLNILKDYVDPKYHRLIELSKASVRNERQSSVYSSENNEESSISVPIRPERRPKSEKIINKAYNENDVIVENVQGLLRIPYSDLAAATQNWNSDNILGRGGFGEVFRGVWKNTSVAIKRLKSTDQNTHVTNETLVELRHLNTYRHDNVLPLYAYSIDGSKSCLIYQLMVGGSLDERLRCKNNFPALSWNQRLVVARGVARGLQFLHTVLKTPLIHGDIKPQNILLDVSDIPRIGDFGLAKLGHDEHTHFKVTSVHGTRPYLPDDYLRSKELSVKVDVYSFGVVMFELATGLAVSCSTRDHKFLKTHILKYLEENQMNIDGLQDPRLIRLGESNLDFCQKIVDIGRQCTVDRAIDRPTMVEVWKTLEALSSDGTSVLQ